MGLEQGFAPLPSQLSQFGLTLTPDDLLASQILEDAASDLKAWTDGLTAPGTSIAQLNALADQFAIRAARLQGVTMSEAGVINAQGAMALLLARRLPALYDALMNELGRTVGIPPVTPIIPAVALSRHGQTPASTTARPRSSLGEVLTTIAIKYALDKAEETLTHFAKQVLAQAGYSAFVMVTVHHVRDFVQGQDIVATVAGASLSFHEFESPYSMIEGEFDTLHPENNEVILIGPDQVNNLASLILSIKKGMKYKDVIIPGANDGKYQNAGQLVGDLFSLRKAAVKAQGALGKLLASFQNMFQPPESADQGCIFSSSPTCGELLYPDGFKTVYEVEPAPGMVSFTGLPVPIVFLVYNKSNGVMYFDTPAFFPTMAAKE